jgi:hypothetical protein
MAYVRAVRPEKLEIINKLKALSPAELTAWCDLRRAMDPDSASAQQLRRDLYPLGRIIFSPSHPEHSKEHWENEYRLDACCIAAHDAWRYPTQEAIENAP